MFHLKNTSLIWQYSAYSNLRIIQQKLSKLGAGKSGEWGGGGCQVRVDLFWRDGCI